MIGSNEQSKAKFSLGQIISTCGRHGAMIECFLDDMDWTTMIQTIAMIKNELSF